MTSKMEKYQASLSPMDVFQILKEGNQRFIKNLKANRNLLQQVNETSERQHPVATVLSCMDSRTSAELIFDQGLGDILSIRIGGAILNPDILACMEYAIEVIKTKVILVLGHTRCGAIIGAIDQVELGNMAVLLDKIQPAIDAEAETLESRNSSNEKFVNNVAHLNVLFTLERIRKESKLIASAEQEGRILLCGGLYQVESGVVNFFI